MRPATCFGLGLTVPDGAAAPTEARLCESGGFGYPTNRRVRTAQRAAHAGGRTLGALIVPRRTLLLIVGWAARAIPEPLHEGDDPEDRGGG